MDKKPKYSLFPTHPPSTPPSNPLPPLPEGQLPSPLAHTTFPRSPSQGSSMKYQATFTSRPLQGLPPQPHLACSSPPSQASISQQPHATFTSSFPPPHQPPVASSREQGPPPHHFDPAFPPPLPHSIPPSHPHVGNPQRHPQAPESQHHQAPLTAPAESEANNPWPPLNNSWPSHEDSASTLKGTPTPAESISSPEKGMHTPTLSTSTTSSSSSLHKPATTNIGTAPSQPQNNAPNTRPRTVYFHSGLGGAGNYHKAIREDNVLKPMIGNRSTHPKFLSSLLGTLGGKKGRRQQQQQQQQQYSGTGSGNTSDGTGSGQSSSQALPLGAAEVMRRKIMGLDGKAKSKC